MNAIAVSKSRMQNWLEGTVLTGLFQGLPTFAAAAMLLKIASTSHLVRDQGGALIFVITTTLFYAILTPWLAPKFPRLFKQSYEPLFFDASLSFSEKIVRWRTQPKASLQLMANVMMLSLLAVAVMTVG
jgi:phosphatidylserine synthase